MIRRLLYLNGVAIVCAVIYHASGWGFTAMFWWTDRYLPVAVPNFDQMGTAPYYSLRVIEQLIIFAIPAFLFVSGFFIAFATGRSQHTVGWHVIGVRIKNLLIPYLIWSTLILLGDYLQGTTYSSAQLFNKVVFGGVAPPYYFVPLLCQLYLISPWLVPLARNRWGPLLIVTALIQISVVSLRYVDIIDSNFGFLSQLTWIAQSWFFPGHIFWFTFGIVSGFHLVKLKNWLAHIKWGLVALVVVTFVAGMIEWETLLGLSGQNWVATRETLVDNIYAASFLLAYLAFDRVTLPLAKGMGELGTKSFGIYLAHSPALEVAARATYHLAPWVLAYQILFQPLLIAVGLAVPLVLMTLVRRSPARNMYQYLFG